MAVIEASGVRRIVPVTQAHGGWAAVELRRRLDDRVEKIVAASWLVLDPPPTFVAALEAAQDPERWREGREQLYSLWLTGAPEGVVEEIRREMDVHDFDMCSRAARAVTADYARHGNPLRALSEIDPKPNILHLFSQPRAPEFLAAQEEFSAEPRVLGQAARWGESLPGPRAPGPHGGRDQALHRVAERC